MTPLKIDTKLAKPSVEWEVKGFCIVESITEYIPAHHKFLGELPDDAQIIDEFKSAQLIQVQQPAVSFLDKSVQAPPQMAIQICHVIYFKVPKYLNKTENEKQNLQNPAGRLESFDTE